MAPLKTRMMALCCGVVLFSAVTAQAVIVVNALSLNGLSTNLLTANGLSTNTVTFNALTYNGLPAGEEAPVEGPRDGLPFTVITRKALGKTHP